METGNEKYACWYRDQYAKRFRTLADFLDYHSATEATDQWQLQALRDLKVIPLPEDRQQLAAAAAAYGIDEGILADTHRNSQLLLKVGGCYHALRGCALQSLCSRARISGESLYRLKPARRARILNWCLALYKDRGQVYISHDKVSAVHSKDYCRLPVTELMEALTNSLTGRFRGFVFEEGYADAAVSSATFRLLDNSVLDAYRSELKAMGKDDDGLCPGLRFVTSNTAVSSAGVRTYICRHGRKLWIGTPVQVAHRHGNNVRTFAEYTNMLYPKFVHTARALQALLHIQLEYPVRAMELVMDKIGIPKKLAASALQLFQARNGINAATAHDVYWGIAEVLFLARSEDMDQASIFALEDKTARALHIRWTDYDRAYALKEAAA